MARRKSGVNHFSFAAFVQNGISNLPKGSKLGDQHGPTLEKGVGLRMSVCIMYIYIYILYAYYMCSMTYEISILKDMSVPNGLR